MNNTSSGDELAKIFSDYRPALNKHVRPREKRHHDEEVRERTQFPRLSKGLGGGERPASFSKANRQSTSAC
jgi:hypothetical protein